MLRYTSEVDDVLEKLILALNVALWTTWIGLNKLYICSRPLHQLVGHSVVQSIQQLNPVFDNQLVIMHISSKSIPKLQYLDCRETRYIEVTVGRCPLCLQYCVNSYSLFVLSCPVFQTCKEAVAHNQPARISRWLLHWGGTHPSTHAFWISLSWIHPPCYSSGTHGRHWG